MDGHWAPVPALRRLADQHGALLVLDDAHSTLVGPPPQAGGDEHLWRAHIHVGTLSKAVGALGGFVACSTAVKVLLISKARGQVYSTALPAPVIAAAHAALRVAAAEPQRKAALWARVQQLQRLTGLPCDSPIISVLIGDEQKALDAAAALLHKGFHVPAIRPPTVPQVCGCVWLFQAHTALICAHLAHLFVQGTARLRVALSAEHSEADVAALAEALRSVGALVVPVSKI
jgi:8-amino-7-oxononanoate synthase